MSKESKAGTKKAVKKQVKRLVRAYGPERALELVTGLVAEADKATASESNGGSAETAERAGRGSERAERPKKPKKSRAGGKPKADELVATA